MQGLCYRNIFTTRYTSQIIKPAVSMMIGVYMPSKYKETNAVAYRQETAVKIIGSCLDFFQNKINQRIASKSTGAKIKIQ